MTTPPTPGAPPSPPFDEALAQLREAGLRLPSSVSLATALRHLADDGLVAPAAVQRFVGLYHRQRFGGVAARLQDIEQACDTLVEAFVAVGGAAPERVSAVLSALAPARPVRPAAGPSAGAHEAGPGPSALPPRATAADAQPPADPLPAVVTLPLSGPLSTVAPVGEQRAPSSALLGPAASDGAPSSEPSVPEPLHRRTFRLPRRWWLWSSLFVLWSLVLLYAGMRTAIPFRDLIRPRISVARGLRPGGQSHRERLQALRLAAGRSPDAKRPWWEYAAFAHRAHAWGDAVLAYRHLLEIDGDDPEALNSLAWLRVRAEEPWARDPSVALRLAERAYALKPEPHITDTLAEAAFLNGDPQRAVALGESALARAERNKDYYRKQLRRFRAAAAEATTGAGEGTVQAGAPQP